MHEVKVQVSFTADTKYGSYGDSLYFTEAEFSKLTQANIEEKKQERIDKWVASMDTVAAPKSPTKSQYQEMSSHISFQIVSLREKKSEIDTKILGM